MSDETLTTGEFARWIESDREWKGDVLNRLIDHSERLSAIEARNDAGRAESAAATTKRWAIVGTVVTAVVNGALLAFGLKSG